MQQNFVALDVETANADLASICQIGIVSFADGSVAEKWQSLVNPEDWFDGMNISIHGIDGEAVQCAPTFQGLATEVMSRMAGRIVASHTPFDRLAIDRACEKYALPKVECIWLDTARVCRRAWKDLSRRGYGLKNVASKCGIEFRHHDAAEDAWAAGQILLKAVAETGLNVEEWVTRSRQPIKKPITPGVSRISREGRADGPLAGEIVVFTGALTLPRRKAADLAAEAGCDVADSVSGRTTLLVVGDQDIQRLVGHDKSSKHRKVEQMISAGHEIRILGEQDFRRLVGQEY